MSRRPSIQRLKTILNRQDPPCFGPKYIPSTLATRDEAPSKSIPSILKSSKLDRDVHVMSVPEKIVALLAIYNPMLEEFHEQKMLCRWESMHPMYGMPGIDASNLPAVMGTVHVAERLGYGNMHPVVFIEDPDNKGRKVRVAYPYQGDFLLFMKNDNNDIYCVNWAVKDSRQSFSEPRMGKRWDKSPKNIQETLARNEIEENYYLDAGIRTQYMCGDEIDEYVASNMLQIYPDTYHKVKLPNDCCELILSAFRSGMESDIPPCDVINSLLKRNVCTVEDARMLLFQAIWNREIRVDMFKPILLDYPLRPERVDVLEHYAAWFKQ